jgi:LPS sulfotransferase NodH
LSEPARSLFVVGAPRSGTSVLFKTLSAHPAFACTTQLTRRFRAHWWLVRVAELTGKRHRAVEAGELWKSFWPNAKVERTEADLTEEHVRKLRNIVDGHCRHFRRPVFLAKRPDFSIRIRWLAAGLPEAKFVHIVRDGRAVARSILEQLRRGPKRRWAMIGRNLWPELLTMEEAAYSGAIWSRTTTICARALATLDPSRVETIRYEDFVADPVPVLSRITSLVDVEWSDEHANLLPKLDNRNPKWREMLTEEEQAAVLSEAEGGLREYGYL